MLQVQKCGKKFRADYIVKGSLYPVQQVGAALGWCFDGLSYREVARNLIDRVTPLLTYLGGFPEPLATHQ